MAEPKRLLLLSLLGSSVILFDPVRADQVYTENVIVNGSIGVGFDAVNNEAFGDDRLRLKENNLRIGFDDVSTDPGDPNNDWEITANESASGGRSFLGFLDKGTSRYPFRVDAGAPADAIRLRDGGRIGILTGAPAAAIQMNVTDDAMSSTEGVVIGPGTVPPTGVLLEVQGPVYISGADQPDLTVDTGGGARLFVEGSAIFSKNVEIASSRTFKEEIRTLTADEISDAFQSLEPVEYRYRNDGEKQLGFIAEDVPGLVATDRRRGLIPMDLIAVLAGTVQERQRRIEAREAQLDQLRDQIAKLKELRHLASPPTPSASAATGQDSKQP